MDNSCISIRQVDKQFETRSQTIQALSNINLEVCPNEFITFVGASGCGKSTLLRILAGLETHSSGDILLHDQPIDGPGVDRAMAV
jgi:NitT/TauT family transport system ATP-binding protein